MAINSVAVLGGVLLDVVEADKPTHAFDVTDKAVEDGSNISDHMHERPAILSITGVIVGADAWTRLSRIRQLQAGRQLVTYTNRTVYSDMAIVSINTEHGADIGNGCKFNIQLRSVRRATAQQVEMAVPTPTATKATQPQNAGTQQVQPTSKQSNNKIADIQIGNIVASFPSGVEMLMVTW